MGGEVQRVVYGKVGAVEVVRGKLDNELAEEQGRPPFTDAGATLISL